jgi:hypothetical protein
LLLQLEEIYCLAQNSCFPPLAAGRFDHRPEKAVVHECVLCYKTFSSSLFRDWSWRRSENGKKRWRLMRGENEPIQIVCPKCRYRSIVYLPVDDLPMCPECEKIQMVIEELLDEGKSY